MPIQDIALKTSRERWTIEKWFHRLRHISQVFSSQQDPGFCFYIVLFYCLSLCWHYCYWITFFNPFCIFRNCCIYAILNAGVSFFSWHSFFCHFLCAKTISFLVFLSTFQYSTLFRFKNPQEYIKKRRISSYILVWWDFCHRVCLRVFLFFYLRRTRKLVRFSNTRFRNLVALNKFRPKTEPFIRFTWSSSSSSSSCRAISTDISEPLSPLLLIVHCFWQVFQATSSICTEVLHVCSSWTSCFYSSLWRRPLEYITYEHVPTSLAVSRMSGSSNFDSFRDGW